MAALQIISLETTTPQLRAPASGDTYSAPRALDITPETLTGSSATSSLSIAQTWNTTGTPTAIDLNVTDTASNANSLLMNLRVGGSSRFSVSKGGITVCGSGASGGVISGDGQSNGAALGYWNSAGGVHLGVTAGLYWGTGGANSQVLDLVLRRDAANTLAQRNGVNAQAFNIYNTYTDASNYERGFVRWNSNRFEIGCDALGTGSKRVTTLYNRDKAGSYAARADIRLEPDAGSTNAALSFQYGGGIHFQWGIDGTMYGSFSTQGFNVGTKDIGGAQSSAHAVDAGFSRIAANVIGVITNPSGSPVGGAMEFLENTAPSAPATNRVRIYAEDNGSGKTRLMALFATGVAQQLAVEP